MQDIADATDCGIASLYRYHGTKLKLVIDIAAIKWREYAELVTTEYERQNGENMNAYEEFQFMMSRYIDLYYNHKELIKYDFNFALYVQHEKATKEDMVPYYESIGVFKDKFRAIMQKGYSDHTIRTDIDPTQLYCGTLYTMLTTAAKYAFGTVYLVDEVLDYTDALQM